MPRRFVALFVLPGVLLAADPLDSLHFGDAASEQAHRLVADHADTITGGLNDVARRLLPRATDGSTWQGGSLVFTLRVNPEQQNYLTVRLWGEDVTHNRLTLLCDGKQIGYRHLGEIDQLDIGTDEPVCPGRFYYVTTPLPRSLTAGRSEVPCEIRASGRIWGYTIDFSKYQKPMTEPSRGIYRVYSHTDSFFTVPQDDPRGHAPAPRLRPDDGEQPLKAITARVTNDITKLLTRADKPLTQPEMEFLARAYRVAWTPAYHNAKVIERIRDGLDALLTTYQTNPKIVENDPATFNPDWFGMGLAADTVRRLGPLLTPWLDQPVTAGGVTRRAGYAAMFAASRDAHVRTRRQYTNQTMIKDLYGIYLSNRGVAALMPEQAWPEDQARHLLYEAVGLEPWRGSQRADGTFAWPLGHNFFQVTPKGLTRELGFVGNYGEVTDWVTSIYKATCDEQTPDGDPRLKAQLAKIVLARTAFRYPLPDRDGYQAMAQETVVGWRDTHVPGNITYAQRPSRDASPIEAAAVLRDPAINGLVQQMFADRQFFPGVAQTMADPAQPARTTMGLLAIPDDLETMRHQPPSPTRLPMTPGAPDYVFSDEVNGVVAVKHGDTILYASLYWRARHGVNSLARVHAITPTCDHIAVVHEDVQFTPSGLTYTRPDWTNWGFATGGPHYDDGIHSAHAGEVLPIAKIPDGVAFKAGNESIYAGRCDFYALRYGRYLIAMNATTDRTFVTPWSESTPAQELVSGATIAPKGFTVQPMSTAVFVLPVPAP